MSDPVIVADGPARTVSALRRMLSYGPALTAEERAMGFELMCVLDDMLRADARLTDQIEVGCNQLRAGPV